MLNKTDRTERKERTDGRLTLALVLVGLAVLAAALYGLYRLFLGLGLAGLAVLATALTVALPFVYALGFWMGKTEVRGFLRAADQLSDKWFDKLTAAVTVKTDSTIRTAAATRPITTPAQVAVVLPGMDGLGNMRRISEQASDTGSVIDL